MEALREHLPFGIVPTPDRIGRKVAITEIVSELTVSETGQTAEQPRQYKAQTQH